LPKICKFKCNFFHPIHLYNIPTRNTRMPTLNLWYHSYTTFRILLFFAFVIVLRIQIVFIYFLSFSVFGYFGYFWIFPKRSKLVWNKNNLFYSECTLSHYVQNEKLFYSKTTYLLPINCFKCRYIKCCISYIMYIKERVFKL